MKKYMSLFLSLVCLPITLHAQVVIKHLRVNTLANQWQYVLDLNQPASVSYRVKHSPYRLYYTIKNAVNRAKVSSSLGINSAVHGVYLVQKGSSVVLELDFGIKVSVLSRTLPSQGSKPHRYVITVDKPTQAQLLAYQNQNNQAVRFNRKEALAELNKSLKPAVESFINKHLPKANKTTLAKSQKSSKAHKNTVSRKLKAVNQSQQKVGADQSQLDNARVDPRIIVMIDPGHGGKDPGATGPRGVHEKRVVLQISRALQKAINKHRGFKAVLTRSDDRYLTLRRRLSLAREHHADMFIAIHADAFVNASAHGASVFALSQRGATSEAARWLAQKENESELMGGVDLADKDQMLRSVLIDLSQTATIGSSLNMGAGLIQSLKKVVPMHSSKVEQAAFVVLKSPDIPSLLVETGFISNPSILK